MLTSAKNWRNVSVELKNSSVLRYTQQKADDRPRYVGGFFMSTMFRGNCDYVQGASLKSQLLISFWWVLNPRNMTPLRRHFVPAIFAKGTTMTNTTNPKKLTLTPALERRAAEIKAMRDSDAIRSTTRLIQKIYQYAEKTGTAPVDVANHVLAMVDNPATMNAGA